MTRLRLKNLGYWAAVLACAELAIGELVAWVRFALLGTLQGPDFFSYYATSLLLLHRGPAAAYDYAVQKQFQDQVTAQWGPGPFNLLPFILPPWAAPLLYPLGLVPFRVAYVAWGVSILVLVGLATWLLLRAAGLRGRRALLAGAAAAAWLPVYVLLLQGQSDALMLAALAGACLAWTASKPAASGGLAALALVKPQLMALLPVEFLVRRSWRAVAAFALVLALLVALALAVFGPAACLQWVRIVAPWAFAGGGGFSVDTQSAYSLRGLLVSLPFSVQVAILALGLLAVAAVLYRTRAGARLQLALALSASFALSPYQHAHDLSLLVAPGILLAGALPELRHPRVGAAALAAAWLGGELLVLVPLATAVTVVLATAYLAYEAVIADPQ